MERWAAVVNALQYSPTLGFALGLFQYGLGWETDQAYIKGLALSNLLMWAWKTHNKFYGCRATAEGV